MSNDSSQLDRFSELVAQITEMQMSKDFVVIAISGFGGSGKTHLANRLRDHLGIKDAQMIRIDHLYSRNPDGPGILDQVDWLLLKKILEQVHSGGRLQYVGKGYRGEAIPVDEPLPKVVIVEGIRLLQPEFLALFDLSVWMDCPQEVALERAKARDRAQGEDEQTVNLWDTDWGPKDKAYFELFRPDQLATILY